MPRPTPQIPSLSSETFTRRIVMPMAGMIVVAVGLVLAFVVVSANGQNRLEVSSSTKLAETALNVNQRQMGRNLRDYAVWEDVYKNLHVKVDFDWAATDGNVGANIYEGLGYEMAFVVNPDGETTYAVIDGVPRQANALDYLPEGLDGLVEAGRSQVKPVVSLLESGPNVLMVAINSILPPSIDRATTNPDELVDADLRQEARRGLPDANGRRISARGSPYRARSGVASAGVNSPCGFGQEDPRLSHLDAGHAGI